jgi:hypothetical protein
MRSSARISQAAQDLQRIINATQAHVQAQPDRFEDVATPFATPNMPQVLRVQMPTSVPTIQTDDNKRITRSMLAWPSVPRVLSNVTPTNMPTDSAKRERIRKRRAARLCNTATPTSTSPLRTNQSPGSNDSSPSCTPFHEHQITSTTIQCTTTFTSTRLCSGSHETAMASMRYGPPLTMHHTNGK